MKVAIPSMVTTRRDRSGFSRLGKSEEEERRRGRGEGCNVFEVVKPVVSGVWEGDKRANVYTRRNVVRLPRVGLPLF